MTVRLPSLNALRAFEASARHLSLTKAAEELSVTPAAISHQLKGLEADFGIKLLRRVRNEFVLTEPAQEALPLLSSGFDQIVEAVRRMRSAGNRHFLTISTGATFATSWLVRRLGRFGDNHPDIDVRLQTSDRLVDFRREGVDVAIRFGTGEYPGLEAIRLFEEGIYPVCSPSLLEEGPPLRKPSDLARHTLLHVDWQTMDWRSPWEYRETLDWEQWLRAAGASEVDADRGPRFSHTSIALQAAIDGQGLALASDSLVRDELAAGRLLRPFEVSLPVAFAYHLVYPRDHRQLPKIAAFREWLLGEIASEAGQVN